MGLFGGGGGFFGGIVSGIGSVFTGVVNLGQSIVSTVVNTVTSVVNTAFSIVSSLIVSKPKIPDLGNQGIDSPKDFSGNRQQIPPASNNKLNVIYGTAWVGGTIIDLSITSNNQTLYYVLALSEVTNSENGNFGDTFTFGNVYWGGRRCVFDPADATKVIKLVDESNGAEDTAVSGNLFMYFYRDGSFKPTNTSLTAVQVMSDSNLIYKWDANKKMSSTVFAIIKLNYNSTAGITGIQQTKFQITSNRTAPASCLLDYMTSVRYGAAIPISQIDTASFDVLNAYSNELITYTDYNFQPQTLKRFEFSGVIDTGKSIQSNMQIMADCCDCLIKYNEVTAKWSVITQKSSVSSVMNITDDIIVSPIRITPIETASTYNLIEVYFPENANQDSFSSVTFDLATINPSLMYQNEPVNKQTVTLSLVNNNVRAQYLANRFLEAAREDLQVSFSIMFKGLQLEAGDIVTVTNAKYGWDAKLFRINQVIENFNVDGSIVVDLSLGEFNPQVYDDVNITQFTPAPNTGIANATAFGTIPAPTISGSMPSAAVPSFNVNVTTSSAGIIQYAEIWYSAFSNPTDAQRIFAGTTAVQSSGTPYPPNTAMPAVTLSNIPTGSWYFFSRMVNSLASSAFSPASAVFNWKPTTYQFEQRYLMIAYADNGSGGGFSLVPTNKDWFGVYNQNTTTPVTNPALYTWYPASPEFLEDRFLLFATRTSRRVSLAVGMALYASQTGAYVPADTANYDQSIWSALPVGINYIDLDYRSGQLIQVGTTAISPADGLIRVQNTQNGTVVAALERFLNFGPGVQYKTSPVANLTIDVFGRVVGFTSPDNFYYTETVFNATSGQTNFTLSHIVGNILIFRSGCLQATADYTETASGFTLLQPCALGEKIVVLNMRATTTDVYYEPLNIEIASSTSNSITYNTANSPYQYINAGDQLTFANTGTPTAYTVSTVNYATRVITFTTTISGATTGLSVYRFRNTGTNYAPFSRYEVTLTDVTSYTPTEWSLRSGFELLFVNGVAYNELDYDITAGGISGLPDTTTGLLTVIQFAENNLSVPCANASSALATTQEGVTEYAYAHNVDAFELYANGMILADSYDYTDGSSIYTLLNTPDNSYTLLQQQTFARVGPA